MDISEEEKQKIMDEINAHPKLPCGHFVENATPLPGNFAVDFICSACIAEGKTMAEAFKVCAKFLEDHEHDGLADKIRELGNSTDDVDHYRALVEAEFIHELHGVDPIVEAVAQHAIDNPITLRDVERELGNLAALVSKENGEAPESLSKDERRLYNAFGPTRAPNHQG